jgi:glycosyltransferase involved in cell wall biosynthesis
MARYIHSVSDLLRDDGHRVDHVFADELDLPVRPGALRGRFEYHRRAVTAVERRLGDGPPIDVVEIHEPIAAGYAWCRRRDPSRWPPLVISVYALEARSFSRRLDCAAMRGERVSLRSRVGPLSVVWPANYALRRADHVLVETTEDRDWLTARLGVPAARVSLQSGGVSEAFFRSEDSTRAGVLFAGTWIARKGVPELVSAMTRVFDARAEVTLTVAGAGTAPERVLNDFPERHRHRVLVAPPTDKDDELAAIFRAHRVFAFPSTFEGMPLALLEAAAAGLAIVTTPTCGMKDFIVDGLNGVLTPLGDSARLADSILQLLDDGARSARLGHEARARVRAFTWRRSADEFLAGCQAAIATSSPGKDPK